MRSCAKLRCGSRASVTAIRCSGSREVLLADLTLEPDRNLVDLCGAHADALTPPVGWRVIDERTSIPAGV